MNHLFVSRMKLFRTFLLIDCRFRTILFDKSRYCSTIVQQLQDKDVIEKLTTSKEDIASFVRFNRIFDPIDDSEFLELYSEVQNPDKSKLELKELQLRIKQICAEYDYHCQLNKRVPTNISTKEMQYLLSLGTPEQRQLYLLRSYFRNTISVRRKVRKIVNRNIRDESEILSFEPGCFDKNGELQYGLWKNIPFLRFGSQFWRLRIQSALNSILYSPILAFDWQLPNDDFKDLFINPLNAEFTIKKLALDIFKICNHNSKNLISLCNPGFNTVHANLDNQSLLFKCLEENYAKSTVDSKFFNYSGNSYIDDYNDKNKIYISKYCKQTISDEELQMHEMDKLLFIVCPYSELFGLKKDICTEIINRKMEVETKQGVQFRRLPTHNSVNPNMHVVLSHYVKCLRDVVINYKSWNQALRTNIPAKYYIKM